MDSDFIRVPELLLGRIDHRHRRRPSSVQIHRYSSPTHHQFEFTPNEQTASTTRGRFTVQTPRSNPWSSLANDVYLRVSWRNGRRARRVDAILPRIQVERLGAFAYSEEGGTPLRNTRTKSRTTFAPYAAINWSLSNKKSPKASRNLASVKP